IHGERVPFLSWMFPISYDKKEFSLFATRNLLRQGIPQHFALTLILSGCLCGSQSFIMHFVKIFPIKTRRTSN
ncbi:MAG: hypothetical protein KA985_02460, partial [Selenomonas sp.]|nr:hypothetical protein [Selenomonas sp.]